MTGTKNIPRTKKMSDVVRGLWPSVAGDKKKPAPPVIVHDPEAQAPHDLDDPFFDRDVQSRMADVIAHSADKK